MEIIGNRQKMFFFSVYTSNFFQCFFYVLQKKLGTKTLITSDENFDGKNDKKKSELELTTESTAKTYRLYVLFIG